MKSPAPREKRKPKRPRSAEVTPTYRPRWIAVTMQDALPELDPEYGLWLWKYSSTAQLPAEDGAE